MFGHVTISLCISLSSYFRKNKSPGLHLECSFLKDTIKVEVRSTSDVIDILTVLGLTDL